MKKPFNQALETEISELTEQLNQVKSERRRTQKKIDSTFKKLQESERLKVTDLSTPEQYDDQQNHIDSLRETYKEAQETLLELEIEYNSLKTDCDDLREKYGKEFYQFIDKQWQKMISHIEDAQLVADQIAEQGDYCYSFQLKSQYIPKIKGKIVKKKVIGHGSRIIEDGLK
jgi:predicted  nucleic acid-binding Zn-ribbon protein